MNAEDIRDYCLQKNEVTEGFPFGDTTLVFRFRDKIFALLSLDEASINLKCDPEKAIELREQFPAVIPGYHMNKLHWNTVLLDGSVPAKLLKEWIDHSYELIAGKRKKSTSSHQ